MIRLALGLLALGLVSVPAEAGPAVNGTRAATELSAQAQRPRRELRVYSGPPPAALPRLRLQAGAAMAPGRPGDRAVAALLVGARLIFRGETMRGLSSFAALILSVRGFPSGRRRERGARLGRARRMPRAPLQPRARRQSSGRRHRQQRPLQAAPEKTVKKAKVRKHRYARYRYLAPRLLHSAAAILVPPLAALSLLPRPSARLRRVPVLLPRPLVVPHHETIRPLRRYVRQERLDRRGTMSKILVGIAALGLMGAASLPLQASAAERQDGVDQRPAIDRRQRAAPLAPPLRLSLLRPRRYYGPRYGYYGRPLLRLRLSVRLLPAGPVRLVRRRSVRLPGVLVAND